MNLNPPGRYVAIKISPLKNLSHLAAEQNLESARIARRVADEVTAENPDKPRFVAGVLGPTSRELITIVRGCWLAGIASMVLPLPMRATQIRRSTIENGAMSAARIFESRVCLAKNVPGSSCDTLKSCALR